MATVTRDQELELRIDSLAHGGRGVARHGELVVFVSRGLPGDRVRARVTRYKKRYAEARVVELLEPGPGRVEPVCPHFGVCGGCAWQDLDYAEQLRYKQEQVEDALRRLGHLDGFSVLPIVPAAERYGYRNKLEYSWTTRDGRPALGFHRAGRWDQLLAVDHCYIASDRSNEVRRAFERWAADRGLEAYDQRSGTGFLRHLVVREGVRSGELLAVLVTAEGALQDAEGLAAALPESVVGVVHAVNDGVAEVTQGLPATLVYGRDWYEERIGGLRLNVSAGAFMQTNTVMSERLYEIAIEFAELAADDVVWDLYCGAGALGLLAARAGAGSVYGIEIHPESVERARENARLNGLSVEFVAGDVARAVRPLLERAPAPTVALVDPPRAGLTPRAVRRVVELAPRRLVYVSCNPTTLAPNCAQLAESGYRLERVQPVDMFPHTPHIECVALLRREPEAAA